MRGAPLRFAAATLAGWVVGRTVALWPAALMPLPLPPIVAPAQAAPAPENVAPITVAHKPSLAIRSRGPQVIASHDVAAHMRTAMTQDRPWAAPPANVDGSIVSGEPPTPAIAFGGPAPPSGARPGRSHWSGDGWLVLRPGGGDALAFGQLGASQGGARLTYALSRAVALSGRASAPLRGSAREAGLGIDLRPTSLPVHVLVEERFYIDDGSAQPAVIAIAGGSRKLPARTRLDAYAQGGAVWRRGGFVDGAMLVARPIVARGNTRVEVGGGAWGAAQRSAARLDVGPSLAVVIPGAGATLRVQLDYRARVAGRARPGSGPALTLGGSF